MSGDDGTSGASDDVVDAGRRAGLALQLATKLESDEISSDDWLDAAAELRRLHAVEQERDDLRAEVERLRAATTMAIAQQAVPFASVGDLMTPREAAGVGAKVTDGLYTWAQVLSASAPAAPVAQPPAQEPLTEDLIILMAQEIDKKGGSIIEFARAIERAHGICKEGGAA